MGLNATNWYTEVGLSCLKRLSKIFQLNRGGQFYYLGKPEYSEKTTDRQTLSHNDVRRTPRHDFNIQSF